MKKILMIFMIIGMVGLLTAGGMQFNNYIQKNKNLETEVFNKFNQHNITNYKISPIICKDIDGDGNNDECKPVILTIKDVVDKSYNPNPSYENCTNYSIEEGLEDECLEWETIYYTPQELESKRDKWEDSVLSIAQKYLSELDKSNIETEIIKGANVTLRINNISGTK